MPPTNSEQWMYLSYFAVNIHRMSGLKHLYLGYGSVNPERMDRLKSSTWLKILKFVFQGFTVRHFLKWEIWPISLSEEIVLTIFWGFYPKHLHLPFRFIYSKSQMVEKINVHFLINTFGSSISILKNFRVWMLKILEMWQIMVCNSFVSLRWKILPILFQYKLTMKLWCFSII